VFNDAAELHVDRPTLTLVSFPITCGVVPIKAAEHACTAPAGLFSDAMLHWFEHDAEDQAPEVQTEDVHV
jgi:hypothetical protein